MVIASRVPLNLVLVNQPSHLEIEDLQIIGQNINRLAPEIHVSIAEPRMLATVIPRAYWQRPTVTVSFGSIGRFLPPRGPIFMNRQIEKLDQYERFRVAGIRTPLTAKFEIGMELPEELWGHLVILKPLPLQLTSTGRSLFLFRSQRLHRCQRAHFSNAHQIARNPMLVQKFIDTGPQFKVYRCLTLFGETLYQSLAEAPEVHPSLESDDDVIEGLLPEPPRQATAVKISTDKEVIDFARQMAAVFPRIPILGCDILRENGTGRLHALEINAGGNVWHISSPRTKKWRKIESIITLLKTFDSFETAARVLIDVTRKHAA